MTWPRRIAFALLVAYSLALAVALFSPTSGEQNQMVLWLGRVLDSTGVPARFTTFDRLEVLTNVAIIAPVSLLGSLAWPRLSWRDWTAWGFAVSLTVELLQGLLLPGRHAAASDVVANTGGALAGAIAVAGLRMRRRSRR
ncbi:MAG: VanZ family protein [Nocardioidaceae bacterium]